MKKWRSTWWFRWISIKDLRETISKFFRTLFSRRMTRHDEICLKKRLNEWQCSTVLMKTYDQVFNLQKRMLLIKEEFLICEFLSDSQAIQEDSLSSILLIELNDLFSLVCFMRMSWFSWLSELCILSER